MSLKTQSVSDSKLIDLWSSKKREEARSPEGAHKLLKTYSSLIINVEQRTAELQQELQRPVNGGLKIREWELMGSQLLDEAREIYDGPGRTETLDQLKLSLPPGADTSYLNRRSVIPAIRCTVQKIQLAKDFLDSGIDQLSAGSRHAALQVLYALSQSAELEKQETMLRRLGQFLIKWMLRLEKDHPNKQLQHIAWAKLMDLLLKGRQDLAEEILHFAAKLPVFAPHQTGLLPSCLRGYLGWRVVSDIMGTKLECNVKAIQERLGTWKKVLAVYKPQELQFTLMHNGASKCRMAYRHSPELLDRLIRFSLDTEQWYLLPLEDSLICELALLLPKEQIPVLLRFGDRAVVCSPARVVRLNEDHRQALDPFLKWMVAEIWNGADPKRMGKALERAVELLLFHPKLAPLLTDLPPKHLNLSLPLLSVQGFCDESMVQLLQDRGLGGFAAKVLPWADPACLWELMESRESERSAWTAVLRAISGVRDPHIIGCSLLTSLSLQQRKFVSLALRVTQTEPWMLPLIHRMAVAQPAHLTTLVEWRHMGGGHLISCFVRAAEAHPDLVGTVVDAVDCDEDGDHDRALRLGIILEQKQALSPALWRYWLIRHGRDNTESLRAQLLDPNNKRSHRTGIALLKVDQKHGTQLFSEVCDWPSVSLGELCPKLLRDLDTKPHLRRRVQKYLSRTDHKIGQRPPSMTSYLLRDYGRFPKGMRQVLDLGEGHPTATDYLISELYRPKHPKLITNLALFQLRNHRDAKQIADMLYLLDRGAVELVSELIDVSRKGWGKFVSDFLDTARVAELYELDTIFDICLSTPDSYSKKLTELLSSENLGMMRALMYWEQYQLYPNLRKEIYAYQGEGPISRLHQHLLSVRDPDFLSYLDKPASSREDALKKNWVLAWLTNGHVEIAKKIWRGEVPKRFRSISGLLDMQLMLILNEECDAVLACAEIEVMRNIGDADYRSKLLSRIVFLASQNRGKLAQILADKDWKAFLQDISGGGLVFPEYLRQAGFRPLDHQFALHAQPGVDIYAQIALEAAQMVVTSGAQINPCMAASMARHLFYVIKDPAYRSQVVDALSTLYTHSNLCFRITQCEVPEVGSQAYRLVQRTVGKGIQDPLSKRDVVVALLATLIYPLRQAKIGSCFATGKVMELRSTPWGLAQVLEDLISILRHEEIRRPQLSPKPHVERRRLYSDDLLADDSFSGDLALARAHEYLLASFGNLGINFPQHSQDTLLAPSSSLGSRLSSGIGIANRRDRTLICEKIAEIQSSLFNQTTELAYLAHLNLDSSSRTFRGAWALMADGATRRIANLQEYRAIQMKVFRKVAQKVYTLFPRYQSAIREAFYGTDGLMQALHSTEFSEILLSGIRSVPDAARINPESGLERCRFTPWVRYAEGSNSYSLSGIIDGMGHAAPYTNRCPQDQEAGLLALLEDIWQLPDALWTSSSQSLSQLLPASLPRHRLNIRPGAIIPYYLGDHPLTPKGVLDMMKRDGESWRRISVDPKVLIASLTQVAQWTDVDPVLLTQILLKTPDGHEKLEALARKLQDALMELGLGYHEAARNVDRWNCLLRRLKCHKTLTPKTLILGDNNWKQQKLLGLTSNLQGRIVAVTVSSENGFMEPYKWNIDTAGWSFPIVQHVQNAHALIRTWDQTDGASSSQSQASL